MIIRKPRPTSNFYLLDKNISEDRQLTWSARGMLVFLLGKPDHWEVSTQALINESKDTRAPIGRDGVRAILGELMAAGYVSRTPARDAGGKLAGFDYHVSEERVQPETAQPGTAQPAPVNPPQVSIESLARTEGKARTEFSSAAPSAQQSTGLDPAKAKVAAAKPKAPKAPKAAKAPKAIKPPKAAPDPETETETKLQAACRATWNAYGQAYECRYSAQPVRNASVSTKVRQLVQRLGSEEAPAVAAFFVQSIEEPYVVRRCHDIGLLLHGCEAYRTQWATNRVLPQAPAHSANKYGPAAAAIFDGASHV
jgi:hypothetical protein